MRVRAPHHLVDLEPVRVDGPQGAQGLHGVAAVEDVVDDALEVVGVVGVGHDGVVVGWPYSEAVRVEVWVGGRMTLGDDVEFVQTVLVAVALEVQVVHGHVSIRQKLHHS